VAYHEVGHALVAVNCKFSDPVHKISILPRGMALGYTLQVPIQDKHLVSRNEMEDQIRILMGGRIAEQLRFNSITSGASNDIDRATEIARGYVCSYGMSEKLGTRRYGKSQGMVFMGRDYSDHSKDYSEATAREIDVEIKELIAKCYGEAEQILKDNYAQLESISEQLMVSEVIDAEAFIALLAGKSLKTEPEVPVVAAEGIAVSESNG
jgi:cell division protease FtsH